jgi:hypothetical protein
MLIISWISRDRRGGDRRRCTRSALTIAERHVPKGKLLKNTTASDSLVLSELQDLSRAFLLTLRLHRLEIC